MSIEKLKKAIESEEIRKNEESSSDDIMIYATNSYLQ